MSVFRFRFFTVAELYRWSTLYHWQGPKHVRLDSTIRSYAILQSDDQFLPKPGGIGTRSVKGHEVDHLELRLTHQFNTAAGEANNQF